MRHPLLDPDSRLVIAHRGNRARAPENTFESLQQAVSLGADALEFDVRVTRDGIPVVFHDADLDRTTDRRGAVASLTFDELRGVDASARSPFATGTPMAVPPLEGVLDRFRDTPMVIEVKELPAVEPTERMIRRMGAEGRVLIGSGDTRITERFYRSGLPCCASMRDAVLLIPLALAGFRPLKPRYDVLSVTSSFHGFPIPVLRMADAARKVGVATQVWTVNDPAVARSLWQGGVSGIVTDDPAELIRARAS